VTGDYLSHGVFTSELLRVLDRPGLSLEQVFKQTAIQVARATNNKQKPWINSSITGDFIFNATAPAATATLPSTSGTDHEALFWQSIQKSTRASDFEAYLQRYPKGTFAPLARSRVREFKPRQSAALPPLAVKVKEIDASYVAVKPANVRAGPGTGHGKIGLIRPGQGVEVTGKVVGKDWYRVALANGKQGFIWGPLLSEQYPTEQPEAALPKTDTASLNTTSVLPKGTPIERYNYIYSLLLKEQLPEAEVAFKEFLEKHGDDDLAGNAQYWLGEIYYARNKLSEAARAFLQPSAEYRRQRLGNVPRLPDAAPERLHRRRAHQIERLWAGAAAMDAARFSVLDIAHAGGARSWTVYPC
jgi:TolA-binding protein